MSSVCASAGHSQPASARAQPPLTTTAGRRQPRRQSAGRVTSPPREPQTSASSDAAGTGSAASARAPSRPTPPADKSTARKRARSPSPLPSTLPPPPPLASPPPAAEAVSSSQEEGEGGGKEGGAQAAVSEAMGMAVDASIPSEVRTWVAQLRGGSDGQKEAAARELWVLAFDNADNKVAIAKAGGIAPLVALARGGTARQKYQAAGALRRLAFNADNKMTIQNAGWRI
uniref:Uncharacterized protein n=1 Tax=Emiliania huxleyi TaxID=2903 RepID=A0A7S3TD12_EMIHU